MLLVKKKLQTCKSNLKNKNENSLNSVFALEIFQNVQNWFRKIRNKETKAIQSQQLISLSSGTRRPFMKLWNTPNNFENVESKK